MPTPPDDRFRPAAARAVGMTRRAVLVAAAGVPLTLAGCSAADGPVMSTGPTTSAPEIAAIDRPSTSATKPVPIAGMRSSSAAGRPARMSITGPGPHHLPYGADDSQWGELYLPAGTRHAGVAVTIHGGFWSSEYGADLGAPLAADMAARGFAAWNLEYRRVGDGGGWPQTFQDVAAGIDHLSVVAPEAGLDLSRVVVIGHSAGGQLAVWAAGRGVVDEADPHVASRLRVTGVVAQAGVLDLTAAARDGLGGGAEQDLLGGDPGAVAARYKVASPQQNLPNPVPVRCVHSRSDRNVPYSQSVDYVSAATKAGGDATLTTVPGDHFSLITTGTPAWEACAAHAVALLTR